MVGSSGGETQWGKHNLFLLVGGRLLGQLALLWKLLPEVPKERSRLDLWVLVTQHFVQACKIWHSLSSTSFRFPETIVNCNLRSWQRYSISYMREFYYQLIAANHISTAMPARTLDPNAFWDVIWSICLLPFHLSNPFSRCSKDCTHLQHVQHGERWLTETGEKSQL